jgi:hypothetical protein
VTGAAQTRAQDDRQENMRMPGVSIEGERQTPDIFFVFPTGKGGNLSAPKVRDYGPDILEPVVKPWLERDEMVTRTPVQAASTQSFNWDEMMKSSPPPARVAPPAAPEAPPPPGQMPPPSLPPPAIPSEARSLPPAGAPPSQPSMPSAPAIPPAAPAAPPPRASGPLYPPGSRPWVPPPSASQPAQSGGSESVPILQP